MAIPSKIGFDPARLQVQLLNTGLQNKDQQLYQLLFLMINAMEKLKDVSNTNASIPSSPSGGGNTTVINELGISQLLYSDYGQDEPLMIPPSSNVSTGGGGTTNVYNETKITQLMYSESESYEPLMIPPSGLISSGGGGGTGGDAGTWNLISTFTLTGQTSKDFIDLGQYSDIRVILRNVTLSVSAEIRMRVSWDNGVTFLASSGDYVAVSGAGAESAQAELVFYFGSSTAGRSGEILIHGWNSNAPKVARSNFFSSDNYNLRIIPQLNPLNAIRIFNTLGSATMAGTVYVLGRLTGGSGGGGTGPQGPMGPQGIQGISGRDGLTIPGLDGETNELSMMLIDSPELPYVDLFEGAYSNPPVDTARVYALDSNGYTQVEMKDSLGRGVRFGSDNVVIAKVTEPTGIVRGQAVFIEGALGANALVRLAKSDNIVTMPAIGIVLDVAANNAFTRVLTSGTLQGVNTSAFVEGVSLFVSPTTAGAFTDTLPVAPAYAQRVGFVTRSHATQGEILVMTTGVLADPRTHHVSHETGGSDSIASLDAAVITSGILSNGALDISRGTLDVSLVGSVVAGNHTYSITRSITYVKFKKLIFFSCQCDIATKDPAMDGIVTINELPFALSSTSAQAGYFPVFVYGVNLPAGCTQFAFLTNVNTKIINLYGIGSGVAAYPITAVDILTTAYIRFSGFYPID